MLVCQGFIFNSGGAVMAQGAGSREQQVRTPLKSESPQISLGALADMERQQSPQSFRLSARNSAEITGGPQSNGQLVVDSPDPYAPPLGGTFDAINFNEDANLNGFFQIPPDPAGAAGPNHVVNVVNSAIEWYTKAGVRQNRQTLSSFFAAAPNPPQTLTFDPKVIYDQYENRFVVVTMERIEASGMTPNQSRVYFAVSDDNDPNGTWRFFTMTTEEVINGRQTWADFPGLAVDADAIYFTNNQFAHNNQTQAGVFQGQRLRIIAKQPYYIGGAAIFNSYDPAALATANSMAGDGFAIATTMQPTQMYGDLPGGLGTFLIAYSGINDFVSGSDANLFVQIIQVDSPLVAPTFTGYFSQWGTIQQNDNLFSGLPGAPQSLTTRRIATNDRRFSQHGVYRNGLLYCAAPILEPSSSSEAGQVSAHWFIINPATVLAGGAMTDPPPVDQGDIGGESIAPGTYTFFPSVAVDLSGNLGIGFAASAPSIFAGSYFTGRLAADPAGTTQPPSTLRPGQDKYIRDFTTSMTVTSRWGDYTGIWLDPSNETTMWVYNENALLRGTVLGGLPEEDGRWGTAWGSFSLTTPDTPVAVPLIISELRFHGKSGATDEFVEIYNPSGASQNLIAIDGSSGYSVVSQEGAIRCIIPNGTVIPARGHFLCTGSGYTLTAYATGNASIIGDIPGNVGIALFPTTNPANFTLANRLDAFGYATSGPLYREGAAYPYSLTKNLNHSIHRDLSSGVPKDTGDNAADFDAVNAEPNIFDYGFPLGAPGPENLASPIQRNAQMPITLLDPTQSATSPPNRERNSAVVPNGPLGTLIIRRKITNNTGQPVTRLRLRIIELTTKNTKNVPQAGIANPCAAPPCADLRAITSPDEAAIGTAGGPVSTNGLTLEEPPGQPVGGGYNSSLRVNNIALATPLAPGASTNINLRLGVQSEGSYNVLINVEALP